MATSNLPDEDSSVILLGGTRASDKESTRTRTVLIVEDDFTDFLRVQRMVSRLRSGNVSLERATCLMDAIRRLAEGGVDVVLLDLGLPESRGIETFQKLRLHAGDVPVIVLSGEDDEAVAIQAAQEGAQDYLVKDRMDGDMLLRSLRYALVRHKSRVRLARALERIHASETNLRNILRSTVDGIVIVDRDGNIAFSNKAARTLLGRDKDELETNPLDIPLNVDETIDMVVTGPQGHAVPVQVRTVPVEWEREPAHLVVLRDLTREKASEQQLRLHVSALESAANAIVLADREGHILWANPAFSQVTGYPREELLGQNFRILKSGKHDRAFYKELWDTILQGDVWHGEIVNRRKNGTLYTAETTITPVRDEQGAIAHFIAIKQDVSDRKRMIEQLKASEERFRQVADTANEGIVLADETANICFWNPFAETIFGYSPNDVLGRPITMLMPERYRQRQINAFQRFSTTGESKILGTTLEVEGLRKDGTEFPIELFLSSWNSDKGRVFCGIIHDVTERKKREEERCRFRKTQSALDLAEHEIALAQKVQKTLFPRTDPNLPGFDISGAVFPAHRASGDYFDFLNMANGCLGIVIADVSGHGLGAAMLMAQTQAYLRSFSEFSEDPGEIVTHTNRRLVFAHEIGHFVELLFLRLDPATRSFVYASAGHRGYLLKAPDHAQQLVSTGPVLGVTADRIIENAGVTVLEPEDIILLMTDGIQETRRHGTELFGTQRAIEVVQKHRHESAGQIVRSLHRTAREFAPDTPQQDDMTVVVIKVEATSENGVSSDSRNRC